MGTMSSAKTSFALLIVVLTSVKAIEDTFTEFPDGTEPLEEPVTMRTSPYENHAPIGLTQNIPVDVQTFEKRSTTGPSSCLPSSYTFLTLTLNFSTIYKWSRNGTIEFKMYLPIYSKW